MSSDFEGLFFVFLVRVRIKIGKKNLSLDFFFPVVIPIYREVETFRFARNLYGDYYGSMIAEFRGRVNGRGNPYPVFH